MEEKEKFYGPPTSFPDKSEIAGIVVAAMPFICNFSTTSTVNGQIVSQTDYAAIALGIVAIGIALSTIRLWGQTPDNQLMKRRGLFVLILGLGAFQLVRGLGLLI
ncbi:MAG: hypothetical protein NPIRA05_19930 [Nitrospirales bacterium]|nr:MAG: hypothetical protein NPIRA05_19930 [Nitrospirales bacterium]